MKYNKLVTLRISEDKHEELEKLADDKETSIGSLIRQAISKYLLDNSK